MGLSVSVLLFAFSATAATPPKPGSTCTKAGLTQSYNGMKYTCIKSGKKLVWDKGVLVTQPSPKVSPSPTQSSLSSPTPTSSATPELDIDGYPKNVPAPGRTCPEEGAKATLYGGNITCVKGVWNLDPGSTMTVTPSPFATPRPSSPVVEVNNSYFDSQFCSGNKLAPISFVGVVDKHQLIVNRIIQIWQECKTQVATSYTPVNIQVEPGYESRWISIPSGPANALIKVFEGNGEKLLQEPVALFGDSDAWLASTGSKYSCGTKIPNQPLGIYCGHVIAGNGYFVLGGASIDRFTSDTKLTNSQLEKLVYAVSHDIATMYELQAQYGSRIYDGTKNQIPAWIREGLVQVFGGLAFSDYLNNGKPYNANLISSGLFEPFRNSLCEKNLQDFESKDRNWGNSCIYSQNLYATELLVAKHGGFSALFDFVKRFGLTDDWPDSFKLAFGVSREDFYKEWYDYLDIPEISRPITQPPAPSVHN